MSLVKDPCRLYVLYRHNEKCYIFIYADSIMFECFCNTVRRRKRRERATLGSTINNHEFRIWIRPLWVPKLFVGELVSVCNPSIPTGLNGLISAGLFSIQRQEERGRKVCAHSSGKDGHSRVSQVFRGYVWVPMSVCLSVSLYEEIASFCQLWHGMYFNVCIWEKFLVFNSFEYKNS